MKKDDISNGTKLLWLRIMRCFRHSFKNFFFNLSLFFVAFSFFVSAFLLLPSVFSKAPVFSYFVKTMELPLDYELEGRIIMLDAQGKSINQKVEVYIGGYMIETNTDETFILDFTSPSTEYIYIVIEYENLEGDKELFSECVETERDIELKKEFTIYV